MLTPEEIGALEERAAELAEPIQEFLLRDIARRIAKAGQLTSTAQYQIWRAQQLGMSRKEIQRELQKLLKVSHKELRALLTQSAEVGYRFDLSRLPTEKAIPFKENGALQQIVAAAVDQAEEDFTNLTQTMGLVAPDGKAYPLQKAYQRCMDYAFGQVATGAADYNTAIRQAAKNLADRGLVSIDYESGVSTSLEAAVRRNVMGGLGLMQERISQRNHDQLGCDGWEISAHAASAPDHEPIQGKQYSDAAYSALNNSLRRRIGTLNCGHAAFPILLGVNKPQYTQGELEQFRRDNEKGVEYEGRQYTLYEATQKQRELERAIRRQKRRILVEEAAGDGEKLTADRIRLQRLNREYATFSQAAGLRTQRERAMVAGFGREQTTEYQRTVAKYAGIRYNKDGTVVVTDDWTSQEYPRIPAQYAPHAVVDTLSLSGAQHDRTIYGPDGRIRLQVHGGDHGRPKLHPFGSHGEHIHEYKWQPGSKKPERKTREVTDTERIQNGDVLGGEDSDS